ncbi:hypothetical protein [Fulvivirga ligni]|uniref:hypothetical protein n=1 Tax=Fulvivirga ligni TaxID=2904246 RepID=UPI001F357D19|nr:hypothetical protein [Fulvivirga ligni]UII24107.1 hypothetical protein LVD16_12850 [Fulvivirga ligni]
MKENSQNSDLDVKNAAEVQPQFTVWLGALIRLVFYLGKRDFKTIYTPKARKKNWWIGFITQLTLIGGFITCMMVI